MILSKFKVAILVILVLIIGCREKPELATTKDYNQAPNTFANITIRTTPEELSNLYCNPNLPVAADTKYQLEFEAITKITEMIDTTYYSHLDKKTKGMQIEGDYFAENLSDTPIYFSINLQEQGKNIVLTDEFNEGDFIKIKAKIVPNFANRNVIRKNNGTCAFVLQNPTISPADEIDLYNVQRRIENLRVQFLEFNQYQTTPHKVCTKALRTHYANEKKPHQDRYTLTKLKWLQTTSIVEDLEKDGLTKGITGDKVTTINIFSNKVAGGDTNVRLRSVIYDDNHVAHMFNMPKKGQKLFSKGIIWFVDIDEKDQCLITLDKT